MRFAQEMIPHHRQAITMANTAPRHDASPDVRALAEKIEKEQTSEVSTMSDWLTSWGEKVPPEQSGMGPGSPSGIPGMMTAQQMDELRGTRGTSFGKKFLTMMIEPGHPVLTCGSLRKVTYFVTRLPRCDGPGCHSLV
ncbi:DUF305 domain-containing protein [Streptomyces sp. RS10V-4]|uniref:DUF305 domain-containing protein n=1 Tax=Streptomyces rhizoryzae TaxID=2932493 RepID=UPI002005A845|nr:DUF305 domain-containing protein [Streptomyces rhizoryzae]MCK7625203.1 DUF305 domain-containing protein [Streptomyces rhizoryzae]